MYVIIKSNKLQVMPLAYALTVEEAKTAIKKDIEDLGLEHFDCDAYDNTIILYKENRKIFSYNILYITRTEDYIPTSLLLHLENSEADIVSASDNANDHELQKILIEEVTNYLYHRKYFDNINMHVDRENSYVSIDYDRWLIIKIVPPYKTLKGNKRMKRLGYDLIEDSENNAIFLKNDKSQAIYIQPEGISVVHNGQVSYSDIELTTSEKEAVKIVREERGYLG